VGRTNRHYCYYYYYYYYCYCKKNNSIVSPVLRKSLSVQFTASFGSHKIRGEDAITQNPPNNNDIIIIIIIITIIIIIYFKNNYGQGKDDVDYSSIGAAVHLGPLQA